MIGVYSPSIVTQRLLYSIKDQKFGWYKCRLFSSTCGPTGPCCFLVLLVYLHHQTQPQQSLQQHYLIVCWGEGRGEL